MSEPGDVRAAVAAAGRLFRSRALADADARAAALRGAAAALREDAGELIALCDSETALGTVRLEGELERTARQLEAFAQLVEDGDYVEATIDTPDPAAVPPRPDLRGMLVAIGPVGVFGASNFPLAFGVAGCDPAAALAAGCPVVAKGHPSHWATSARAAAAVRRGLTEAGLPADALTIVAGASTEVGEALVDAPELEAVAFTGSLAGGRALFDRAAARPRPIPVYAEMGSVNPIVVTEAALATRWEEIVVGLAASVTGSAGQLCTKPGVVLLPAGAATDRLSETLAGLLDGVEPQAMLNERLRESLAERVGELERHPEAERLTGARTGEDLGTRAAAAAWRTSARAVIRDPSLLEERFGPVVVLVSYRSDEELHAALEAIPGQLTGSIHAEDSDDVAALVDLLATRSGRVVFDGFPTGVAIGHAMHHGGPYPATTFAAHTSVGQGSIRRFLRPVAWQNAPERALPAPLRDENPLGIWRRIDGQPTRAGLSREAPA